MSPFASRNMRLAQFLGLKTGQNGLKSALPITFRRGEKKKKNKKTKTFLPSMPPAGTIDLSWRLKPKVAFYHKLSQGQKVVTNPTAWGIYFLVVKNYYFCSKRYDHYIPMTITSLQTLEELVNFIFNCGVAESLPMCFRPSHNWDLLQIGSFVTGLPQIGWLALGLLIYVEHTDMQRSKGTSSGQSHPRVNLLCISNQTEH